MIGSSYRSVSLAEEGRKKRDSRSTGDLLEAIAGL